MMIRYFILLVGGLMLGGCCLSGNCYAPVAAGPAAPVAAGPAVVTYSAPDGLGPAATDESQADVPAKPRKTAQRRRDTIGDSDASAASRYRDSFEEQEATDRAEEARLKRKLIICQNCATAGN
jgi:hypothetical protein